MDGDLANLCSGLGSRSAFKGGGRPAPAESREFSDAAAVDEADEDNDFRLTELVKG